MKGITFNGKHSYRDFGLLLESYKVNMPSKRKVVVDVPYRHGSLDFSTLYTGENIYEDRVIEVKLAMVEKNIPLFKVKLNRVAEWLLDTIGRQELIFDDTPDYSFSAEVNNEYAIDEFYSSCSFTVKFTANPFRVGTSYVGSKQLWDTFNFLEDALFENYFILKNETKKIEIINVGRKTIPLLKVVGNIRLTIGNYTVDLTDGETIDYSVELIQGINELTITGTGEIEIEFKKEAF